MASRPERKGPRPVICGDAKRELRQIVRAVLPLGEGTVLDPFAGSGSTLAACEAVSYASVGVELDHHYVGMARTAIPELNRLIVPSADGEPS